MLPGWINNYILAGTEQGLGIPPAPLFVSCSYNSDKNQVEARWVNPPCEYDCIWVVWHWKGYIEERNDRIEGTATSLTRDCNAARIDVNDLDVCVVGIRANLPSNAGAIYLSNHRQSEAHGIPFAGGIAPNWAVWSTWKTTNTAFEQGERHPDLWRRYNHASSLMSKPYYQVIKAPGKGQTHGLYRKFLGLTPGHTYRLVVCATALDIDSAQGDWSFDVLATHNGSEGRDLSAEQFAGLAALPNGATGREAGRIVYNTPHK